jgi:hypothetical protein
MKKTISWYRESICSISARLQSYNRIQSLGNVQLRFKEDVKRPRNEILRRPDLCDGKRCNT